MAAAATKASASAGLQVPGGQVLAAVHREPLVVNPALMKIIEKALEQFDAQQGHVYNNMSFQNVACILAHRGVNSAERFAIGNNPKEMYIYLVKRGIDEPAATLLSLHPSIKSDVVAFDVIKAIAALDQPARIDYLERAGFTFTARDATTALADKKYEAFAAIFAKIPRQALYETPYANEKDTARTWLHLLATHNSESALKAAWAKLLQTEVPHTLIDQPNGMKDTALHIAALANNGLSVRALLQGGANYTLLNGEGHTALALVPPFCWCRDRTAREELLRSMKPSNPLPRMAAAPAKLETPGEPDRRSVESGAAAASAGSAAKQAPALSVAAGGAVQVSVAAPKAPPIDVGAAATPSPGNSPLAGSPREPLGSNVLIASAATIKAARTHVEGASAAAASPQASPQEIEGAAAIVGESEPDWDSRSVSDAIAAAKAAHQA